MLETGVTSGVYNGRLLKTLVHGVHKASVPRMDVLINHQPPLLTTSVPIRLLKDHHVRAQGAEYVALSTDGLLQCSGSPQFVQDFNGWMAFMALT